MARYHAHFASSSNFSRRTHKFRHFGFELLALTLARQLKFIHFLFGVCLARSDFVPKFQLSQFLTHKYAAKLQQLIFFYSYPSQFYLFLLWDISNSDATTQPKPNTYPEKTTKQEREREKKIYKWISSISQSIETIPLLTIWITIGTHKKPIHNTHMNKAFIFREGIINWMLSHRMFEYIMNMNMFWCVCARANCLINSYNLESNTTKYSRIWMGIVQKLKY